MERRVDLSLVRTHDLVRVTDPELLVPSGAPDWVLAAVSTTPWVVVRRAAAAAGQLSVGVRGATRALRHATAIPIASVAEALPPEALVPRIDDMPTDLPARRSLHAARRRLDALGETWGPTGSMGFELAAGAPTVTPESDLDLVVRARGWSSRARFERLAGVLAELPARVDCQIETAEGAIALTEIVSDARELLLRTPTGPRLIESPWWRAS